MFSKSSNLLGTSSIIRDTHLNEEAKLRQRRLSLLNQRRDSLVGYKANVSIHQYTEDPTVAWEMLREKRPVKPVRQMRLDTPVKPDHVRFVCIGCTHGEPIEPSSLPPGDVLLIAGDFTSCGMPQEVHAFNKLLGSMKHAFKVVIGGNHECTFDEQFLRSNKASEAKEMALKHALHSAMASTSKTPHAKQLLSNALYLEDSVIELFGITIYGTPWQPKVDNWAFNLPRGQSLLDKWNLIPSGVDVLLTHTPPLGHGDQMLNGQRMGCVELLNTVFKRVKPKYHVFSHIHEGYGCTTDGYTKFINCCACDENLELKNDPIIFDIPVHPHTKQFYLQNVKKIVKRGPKISQSLNQHRERLFAPRPYCGTPQRAVLFQLNCSETTPAMNNSTTAWDDDDECGTSLIDENFVRIPVMCVYVVVFVVCLLGNLFTILVITTHPMMRTATNFFLANLAAADLLVAIFCILQNMIHIVGFDHGNWPLGELLCKMYLMVLHLVPCTSVGILVCVSLEKYIAVLHPLTAMKVLTNRLRMIVTIAIWMISLSLNLPFFFRAKLYTFHEHAACTRTPMPFWITMSFFIWYIIPLIVLGFIYSRIGVLLWTSGSRSVSTRQSSDSQGSAGVSWQMANGRIVVYKQESLLQVPDERKKEPRRPKETEGRRKVVRLLFAVVLSFALLTLPHHARLIHSSWSVSAHCSSDWTSLLQPFSYICLFVSSAINPILYAFLSRRFRNAVADILQCRKGVFSKISRSRNRTLVSDVPPEESRCNSPHPMIRMNRLR
ncbi:unnamed protein product [Caenorhabditis auriculariae]|uniref:G-protein coupled receptors family 1 profile domain-containing protein n=1 Tax=Caenorhabditis auriculariae TaxID=2777116 RepID=A0A8S1HK98_9PELO|nr:unnamed protein product [Caenorhabditis auriculariae]